MLFDGMSFYWNHTTQQFCGTSPHSLAKSKQLISFSFLTSQGLPQPVTSVMLEFLNVSASTETMLGAEKFFNAKSLRFLWLICGLMGDHLVGLPKPPLSTGYLLFRNIFFTIYSKISFCGASSKKSASQGCHRARTLCGQ